MLEGFAAVFAATADFVGELLFPPPDDVLFLAGDEVEVVPAVLLAEDGAAFVGETLALCPDAGFGGICESTLATRARICSDVLLTTT